MTRANLNRRIDAEETRRDLAEKYRNAIAEQVHREWGIRIARMLDRVWDELDLSGEQREQARAVLLEELDKVSPEQAQQDASRSDEAIG